MIGRKREIAELNGYTIGTKQNLLLCMVGEE